MRREKVSLACVKQVGGSEVLEALQGKEVDLNSSEASTRTSGTRMSRYLGIHRVSPSLCGGFLLS